MLVTFPKLLILHKVLLVVNYKLLPMFNSLFRLISMTED